ncbi:hypothetical protein [Crenobacter cavernae]|uniref:hypothetical protein n=1 Tax=Crenobacter cavernae TaxID=2290923 RepID=UPI0011C03E28|nr:hypothetical protein [Crenobacter cavernae]
MRLPEGHAGRFVERVGGRSARRTRLTPTGPESPSTTAPGQWQMSRPYPSVGNGQPGVTLSIAFEIEESLVVLCTDVDWEPSGEQRLARRKIVT